jgi:hypothetical protein
VRDVGVLGVQPNREKNKRHVTTVHSRVAQVDGEPAVTSGDLFGTINVVQILESMVNVCMVSDTKERIFRKNEEARDLLRHHPLTPEQAIDLLTRFGVGALRYSAALVPWTEKEQERLEAMWVQAYNLRWAWGLPWTTASDVFTLPSVVAGMEYPRPVCIMA